MSEAMSSVIDDSRPQHSRENSTIRRSGIPGVENIQWGEHLCAFYSDKKALLKLVVSYIQAGLESNEFCMWITGEPVSECDAHEALASVLPQTQQYLLRKQLEIVPYHQWYLSSGRFDEATVLKNWGARARYAEAQSFDGIRITGNPFWLHSEEEWAQFGSYEKKVEESIKSERLLALCTYPTDRCSHEHMLQILSNHGSTLIMKRLGEWQRMELRRP